MADPFVMHLATDDGVGGTTFTPMAARASAADQMFFNRPDLIKVQPLPDPKPPAPDVTANLVENPSSRIFVNQPPVSLLHPELVHAFDPNLINIWAGPAWQGQPREQLTVPIADSPAVTVASILSQPKAADAGKLLFIPTWQLAMEEVSSRYRIKLDLDKLTVYLKQDPAPPKPPGATVSWDAIKLVPGTGIRVSLTYNGNNARVTRDFTEVTDWAEGPGLKAVMSTNKALIDELFPALTEPTRNSVLTVARSLRVGILSGPGPRPWPRPIGASIAKIDAGQSALGPKRIPIDDGGGGDPPPDPTGPPPTPLYLVQDVVVSTDIAPTPFSFIKETNGYIFQGVTNGGGATPPMRRVPLTESDGTIHYYYQDRVSDQTFYYLPDSFKLSRLQQPPYYPNMMISVAGDSADTAMVTLSYVARAITDPDRLFAAAAALKPFAGGGDVHLVLFQATTPPKFRLILPGSTPTDGPYEARAGASVDMATATLRDVITRPLTAFQQLFDSMTLDAGPYFLGDVTLHVADNDEPVVQFRGRANDMFGPLLDVDQSLDGGKLKVTLKNGIEGTVHLPDLSKIAVSLMHAGALSADPVITAQPALPADLKPAADPAPAGAVSLTIAPKDGSAAADGDSVALNLRAASVKVDPIALWNTILDQRVAPRIDRKVTVKVPAALFGPADTPNHQLIALQIQFEGGASVDVAPPAAPGPALIQADCKLQVPISDYVLRKPEDRNYRYKVNAIYPRQQVLSPDWHSDHAASIFITDIPPPVGP